jgi:hypothetical protein
VVSDLTTIISRRVVRSITVEVLQTSHIQKLGEWRKLIPKVSEMRTHDLILAVGSQEELGPLDQRPLNQRRSVEEDIISETVRSRSMWINNNWIQGRCTHFNSLKCTGEYSGAKSCNNPSRWSWAGHVAKNQNFIDLQIRESRGKGCENS